MQIVIDIPEWKYKSICEGVEASKRCGVVGPAPDIHEAIANGIPLPKGHGDLIDRRELKKDVYTTTEWNGDVHRIIYEASVDDAPTIIPADKRSEDNEEVNKIEKAPSVNPQPKMGHWIEHKVNGALYIKCSECSCYFREKLLLINNYCPYCGVKMQKEEK